MVELHGGRIRAASAGEGCGTTIHLTLPIGEPDALLEEEALCDEQGQVHRLGASLAALAEGAQPESEPETQTSARTRPLPEMNHTVGRWADRTAPSLAEGEAAPPASGDRRAEVLIAEDNPDMRSLLEMLVGREFRVRTAKNGREALEAIQASPPDLLLSDVMMPELSGTELCKAVKQGDETRGIPVVLVTSKAEREMKIEGLELGADDYVTKPFHPRELLARIRALVRVTSLQRELADRNEALEGALGELKQAEVQLVRSERLAAVGELAAGLAHEVNNPVNFALNAVRAMEATVKDLGNLAEAIADMDPSDPQGLARRLEAYQRESGAQEARDLADNLMELAQIVGEGLKRTSSLVGDLREFARPGRDSQMRAGVDLEAGLRSTLTLVGHAISAANAQLEIDVEPGLPKVKADPAALNQVFLNLLKNAVEAQGGRRDAQIRVELAREDGDVVARVADDGPGISAQALPQVFEPFYTTKDAEGGTGLGLSISHRIAADHGGTLAVESEEGQGAVFTLRIPSSEEIA
jgi:signal transduction histidine kinase